MVRDCFPKSGADWVERPPRRKTLARDLYEREVQIVSLLSRKREREREREGEEKGGGAPSERKVRSVWRNFHGRNGLPGLCKIEKSRIEIYER